MRVVGTSLHSPGLLKGSSGFVLFLLDLRLKLNSKLHELKNTSTPVKRKDRDCGKGKGNVGLLLVTLC